MEIAALVLLLAIFEFVPTDIMLYKWTNHQHALEHAVNDSIPFCCQISQRRPCLSSSMLLSEQQKIENKKKRYLNLTKVVFENDNDSSMRGVVWNPE